MTAATYDWAEIPAEGLEQLWDHGGQLVQLDQCILWWQRPSHWLRALHSVRVKAQSFEPVHAEMWKKKKPLGGSVKWKKLQINVQTKHLYSAGYSTPLLSLFNCSVTELSGRDLVQSNGVRNKTVECQVTLQCGQPRSWYSRGCKTRPHIIRFGSTPFSDKEKTTHDW